MLTEKQRLERLSGIGSSDAPVVLGLSPYKTIDVLFDEKVTGIFEPEKYKEKIEWGNALEPAILKAVEQRLGYPVKKPKKMLRHPTHTFMTANLDGMAEHPGAFGVVEAKNMGWPIGKTKPNMPRTPDGKPQPKVWHMSADEMKDHYYYYQLMHQMIVTGCLWGGLAILVGGNCLRLFEFKRDEQLMNAMIQIEREFWDRVLTARKEIAA